MKMLFFISIMALALSMPFSLSDAYASGRILLIVNEDLDPSIAGACSTFEEEPGVFETLCKTDAQE